MASEMLDYTAEMLATPIAHEKEEKIKKTYIELTKRLKEMESYGSCYLYAVYAYVLLQEQGIENVMKIGYAKFGEEDTFTFGHGWNEIDGLVYDVSIQWTGNQEHYPPILAGMDMGSKERVQKRYNTSVKSKHDADMVEELAEQNIEEYFSYFDHLDSIGYNGDGDGWRAIVLVGERLGLTLDIKTLQETYNHHVREKHFL